MKSKKKKSKITLPGGEEAKVGIIAFRPNRELNRLLKNVNKTEVIQKALALFFSAEHQMTCPTCKGVGKIVRVK